MTDEAKKAIGLRISKARSEAGYTSQYKFGKALNINQATINRWENGTNTPDTEQIIKIAKKLNVSTDYLLGLSDVMTSDAETKAICKELDLSQEAVEGLYCRQILSNDIDIIEILIVLLTNEDMHKKTIIDEINDRIINHFALKAYEAEHPQDSLFNDFAKAYNSSSGKNMPYSEWEKSLLDNIREKYELSELHITKRFMQLVNDIIALLEKSNYYYDINEHKIKSK